MKIKHQHLEGQYKKSPALLRLIAEDFERLSMMFGIMPTITRITDKVSGESGVHPANRAIDIRDEHGGKSVYTESQKDALVTFINALYPRTDGKHTLLHHAFNGGAYHFHMQIPFEQTSILLARD